MVETDKSQWILSVCTRQAPSYEKVRRILEEKEIIITPRDYLKACTINGLEPDIHPVFIKINEGSATLEDINLLLEDVGDAVEERINRKVRKSPGASHITHGGRQKLGGERMAARTGPKRQRSDHTQKHGRGKHGHDNSTDTQRQNAS